MLADTSWSRMHPPHGHLYAHTYAAPPSASVHADCSSAVIVKPAVWTIPHNLCLQAKAAYHPSQLLNLPGLKVFVDVTVGVRTCFVQNSTLLCFLLLTPCHIKLADTGTVFHVSDNRLPRQTSASCRFDVCQIIISAFQCRARGASLCPTCQSTPFIS